MSNKSAQEARSLYRNQNAGILSTISLELPGYPFGSLTPYAPDELGRPVLLISDIAEHTANIRADSKVSLTVKEADGGQVQAQGRITIVGDAKEIPGEEAGAAERYFAFFPYARRYAEAHNFNFFRIDPVRVRFIGGFGKIFWVEPDEFMVANPFDAAERGRIIEHMNADHTAALRHYLRHYLGIQAGESDPVTMVDIDRDGIDLLHKDANNFRINFEAPISNSTEARETLTRMAHAS